MTDLFDQALANSDRGNPVVGMLVDLRPKFEGPHAQWQVVELVNRTGNGKITVRETVGMKGVYAVLPMYLHEHNVRPRKRVATATLLQLPWAGAGPDPGLPLAAEERAQNAVGNLL